LVLSEAAVSDDTNSMVRHAGSIPEDVDVAGRAMPAEYRHGAV
jgi:hypothetical protein